MKDRTKLSVKESLPIALICGLIGILIYIILMTVLIQKFDSVFDIVYQLTGYHIQIKKINNYLLSLTFFSVFGFTRFFTVSFICSFAGNYTRKVCRHEIAIIVGVLFGAVFAVNSKSIIYMLVALYSGLTGGIGNGDSAERMEQVRRRNRFVRMDTVRDFDRDL